ncbi:MAG: IS30 family transposase, partial [Mogibacterium sp.]|nr:IS30 family transposase [Mogibacterium sp.]
SYGRGFNDCIMRRSCKRNVYCDECPNTNKRCSACGQCIKICEHYEKEVCSRLEKPPYVCNGCPEDRKCTLERHYYKARYAQKEYKETLSESRSGFCITEDELAALNRTVSPLIKNGQSIHHISLNHSDEIHYSEKTLYNFMDAGLLDAKNIDLPRKVRFRVKRKKSSEFKVDKKCRIGRTYEDFNKYCEEHPDLPVVEIDSVEGKKGSAVLLTIYFRQQNLQLAYYREANDSKSVTAIFHDLYEALGTEMYKKLFPIVLGDNGSEFSDPTAIEFDENGEQISHVFYCDPQASYQKPGCENNHEMIRRVIPKGVDIAKYDQDKISLMMSHINSYKRPILGDKSPYDLFEFTYGRIVLEIFGLRRIDNDDIILTPSLLS